MEKINNYKCTIKGPDLIESLATKPEFKYLRELAGKIVELRFNGLLGQLLENGEVTVKQKEDQLEVYFKKPRNEEETDRKIKIEEYIDGVKRILVNCGVETPVSKDEIYSGIIEPLVKYQIKRSL